MKINRKYFLIMTFFLALVLRLFYTGLTSGFTENTPKNDASQYHEIAVNLSQGHGYTINEKPTAVRPPVMPVSLAVIYKVFGISELNGRLFLLMISCLVPFIGYFLALLLFNERTASFSALWLAFYPFLIHESSMLDTENIFIPLFLAACYYLTKLIKENFQKAKTAVIAGVLLGLAILTRDALLFFFPYLLIWLFIWLFNKQKINLFSDLKKLKILLLPLLIIILFVGSWAIRNKLQLEKYILGTTGTYEVLLGSYNRETFTNPRVAGNFIGLYRLIPQAEYTKMENDHSLSRRELQKTLKKYWPKIPWLTLQKFKWFWHFSPKHPWHRNLRDDLVGLFSYGIFLPFFIIGLLKNRNKAELQVIIAAVFYFLLISLITYGSARLRLPIDTFIIIIAWHQILSYLPKWSGRV